MKGWVQGTNRGNLWEVVGAGGGGMCLYIILLLFLLLRSRTPAQLSGGRLAIILLRQAAPTATLLFRAGTDRLRNSEEDRTRMDGCNREKTAVDSFSGALRQLVQGQRCRDYPGTTCGRL